MRSHHLLPALALLVAPLVGCAVPAPVDWPTNASSGSPATTADTADTADTDVTAAATDTTPSTTAEIDDATADPTTTSTTSAPSTSAPTASDAGTIATDGSLSVALTVHVERHDSEISDQGEFDRHVATLEQLATLAEQYGVIVNFELSTAFVTAVDTWDSTFIEDMVARGHRISQHSGDRSTDGLTGQARIDELTRQREAIEAHGVEVTYVSGGCSNDPGWVEDAIAAGFDAVTGLTEICLGSLSDEALPDGMEWIRRCTNAAICHDPLQIQLERLLHPWTTSSTTEWLVDDPTGALVIIAGQDTSGLTAMSQTGDADDATALADWQTMLGDAAAAAVPGQVNVVNVVLSVGPTPDWAVLESMFADMADRVADGGADWVGLADVVAAAVAEATVQPADAVAIATDTTPDLGGRLP